MHRLDQPHGAQDCQIVTIAPDNIRQRSSIDLIDAQPRDHGVGGAVADADRHACGGGGIGQQQRERVTAHFVACCPHR